jgi:hypothetical protein
MDLPDSPTSANLTSAADLQSDLKSARSEIRWPPRVSKAKLRRLYEADAQGIVDQELIDDVGITLLLRCQAILDVAEAKAGCVKCPRCARAASLSPEPGSATPTIIQREHTPGEARDELLACPVCDWQITWGEYAKTFKRRQLHIGGAGPFFGEYVERYPSARTPRLKMLAIDRLIHQFHYSLRGEPDLPTRSVGPNLIQGKLGDVLLFLDELTYGPGSTEGLAEMRREWQDEYAKNMRSMLGGTQLAKTLLGEIKGYLGMPFETALAEMRADRAAQPDAFTWTKVRIALEVLLERARERGRDRWVEKLLAPHLPESVPDVRAFLTRIYGGLFEQETGFLKPKNPVSGGT